MGNMQNAVNASALPGTNTTVALKHLLTMPRDNEGGLFWQNFGSDIGRQGTDINYILYVSNGNMQVIVSMQVTCQLVQLPALLPILLGDWRGEKSSAGESCPCQCVNDNWQRTCINYILRVYHCCQPSKL